MFRLQDDSSVVDIKEQELWFHIFSHLNWSGEFLVEVDKLGVLRWDCHIPIQSIRLQTGQKLQKVLRQVRATRGYINITTPSPGCLYIDKFYPYGETVIPFRKLWYASQIELAVLQKYQEHLPHDPNIILDWNTSPDRVEMLQRQWRYYEDMTLSQLIGLLEKYIFAKTGRLSR